MLAMRWMISDTAVMSGSVGRAVCAVSGASTG